MEGGGARGQVSAKTLVSPSYWSQRTNIWRIWSPWRQSNHSLCPQSMGANGGSLPVCPLKLNFVHPNHFVNHKLQKWTKKHKDNWTIYGLQFPLSPSSDKKVKAIWMLCRKFTLFTYCLSGMYSIKLRLRASTAELFVRSILMFIASKICRNVVV